jgi:hypothetical protein
MVKVAGRDGQRLLAKEKGRSKASIGQGSSFF